MKIQELCVSLEPPVARLSVQFVTVCSSTKKIFKEDETELLRVVQEYVHNAAANKKKL